MKYKVWNCKIVVGENEKLPMGFDFPPRRGAIEAIEKADIEVIGCFSGWAGKLTKSERKFLDECITKTVEK